MLFRSQPFRPDNFNFASSNFLKDKTERKDLPNDKSKSIYLESDGIVVQGEIKEVFGVTEETPYTITITNVDDKPAHFEAQVVDR